MLFSEFKEYINNGEFSLLNLGEDLENEKNLAKLVSGINLGVLELYKKFSIKVDTEVILVEDGVFEYSLPEDCLKVLKVFNANDEELPLNNEYADNSAYIIGFNTIKIKSTNIGSQFTVEYRATPTKLDLTDEGTGVIELPQVFIEALLNYVAYRGFAAINMNSAEAVNYYAKFLASCAMIDNYGLWDTDSVDNTKLQDAGWL